MAFIHQVHIQLNYQYNLFEFAIHFIQPSKIRNQMESKDEESEENITVENKSNTAYEQTRFHHLYPFWFIYLNESSSHCVMRQPRI